MIYDTHVCLVSAQATPNLIPALDEQWRPRRVILATSSEMSAAADYLASVLQRRGVAIERLPIDDAYDYFRIYDTFFAFLDEQKMSVALNVTGGTKIMAMAAQEAFGTHGKPVFYVNAQTDEILVLGDRTRSASLVGKVKLADFLEAHGYTFADGKRPAKPQVTREQSDLTNRIVEGVERFGPALGQLNALAAQAKGSLRGKLDDHQRDSIILKEIVDLFVEGGHVHCEGQNLRFTSDDSRAFVGGGWLEKHVLKALADLAGTRHFTDYGMNMKVLLPNRANSNEIDAAFLHQNTLHLIECKAANLAATGNSGDDKGTEAIYKLETLFKMGGLRTRGMLIDYRGRLSITHGNADKNRVEANLARARAANIRIVSGVALKTLKNEISQWIA
jgi:Domain of unknown function (DUF1887)